MNCGLKPALSPAHYSFLLWDLTTIWLPRAFLQCMCSRGSEICQHAHFSCEKEIRFWEWEPSALICSELLTTLLKTGNHSYVVKFCYIYFILQIKARHIITVNQTVAGTCFQYFILFAFYFSQYFSERSPSSWKVMYLKHFLIMNYKISERLYLN